MLLDEGYIKFEARWTPAPPLPWPLLQELNHWRQKLYRLGLVGAYPDGIGFGNLSMRWAGDDEQFAISGSTTGNFAELGPEHYTLVEKVELENNRLFCRGPIVASSESMSHAAVYQGCARAKFVFHVHHLGMWERLLHQVPTTKQGIPYGTPEMAWSILDLLENTDLPSRKIFVMEGHREGIFVFGETAEEAGEVLLAYY